MKPLHLIAVGLLVVALQAPAGDYDLFADPLGWVLVLLGLPAFRGDGARLTVAGLVALATSVALYVPAVREALDRQDALDWAASLPQVVFTGLLCYVLAQRAATHAGARKPIAGMNEASAAAAWLRLTLGLVVLVGVAPVLVLGAGLEQLRVATSLVSELVSLLVVLLLLIYAGRPWAPSAAEVRAADRPD